ncbi:phage major capsid protein [Eubacterium barkeri]|uniref:Phage major capsid protein, HK97 family n=1 Tax=Eubacterium barkeri TaxID=1528 RepID=A0A1H3BLE3_EUBBA|nr:phage major capsid protein [Eubacterium barkeri]SDX41919.1 phage major capsid protein, HK97 family [Eubacterium barkeri]
MTKLQELENERQGLLNKVDVVTQSGSVKDMQELTAELERVNAQIELERITPAAKPVDPIAEPMEDTVELFMGAIRGTIDLNPKTNPQIKNVMVEGTDSAGGYTVPEDVQTRIIEFQRKKFDIRPYLNIETVSTESGKRTVRTNKPQASGFASVAENAQIQAHHEPTFGQISYKIQKYAGYIPVTNELIDDSTENFVSYLSKWMGEGEVNTYNYRVFNGTGSNDAEGILTEMTTTGKLKDVFEKKTDAPTIEDFKKVFNTKLNTIVEDDLKIFTTPTGYNFLDNLKNDGKPALQPDPTKKSGYVFLGYEIVCVPGEFLKEVEVTASSTTTKYTPFIMGDLSQLYTLFDRKMMSVETTRIGGDAWRKDLTEIKGVFRFDGKLIDCESVYALLVDTTKL